MHPNSYSVRKLKEVDAKGLDGAGAMISENLKDHAAAACSAAALTQLDHSTKMAAAEWARQHQADPNNFDRNWWDAASAAGYLSLMIGETFGGSNASATSAALAFEGLGLGSESLGMTFAAATQVFTAQLAISRSASDAQKADLLPKMATGELIASFAMSEPHSGSDPTSIRTTARPSSAGGFIIDGIKSWVSLGPVADVIVVFASTAPDKGVWGLTAFVVDATSPGVRRGEPTPKAGLGSCPFATIEFEGCYVAERDVLGSVGGGMAVFTAAVEAEKVFLYAAQIGAIERLINRCVERVSTRQSGDGPLGKHQAVSHRIAEMKLRHELARNMLYKSAYLYDSDRSMPMEAALTKIAAADAAVQCSLDAVKLFGAEGYTEAAGIVADLNDALGGLSYAGTAEVQKNIVARLLGTDRPRRTK